MASASVAAELQDLVRRVNDAWVAHRFEELNDYFHSDVVVVTPDFATRVHGRAACIASYRDFVTSATVHSFQAAPAQIDVVDSTAVAVVPYDIDYEIPSGRWRGSGREVLVLARHDAGWLIVWRLLLSGEETPYSSG